MANLSKEMLGEVFNRCNHLIHRKKSTPKGGVKEVSPVRRSIMVDNTLDKPQDAFEKIQGSNNLTSIAFLLRGFEVSHAVGLIYNTEKDFDNAPVGTGFLIAPNLLITNNHVIRDRAEAEKYGLRMNYQRNLNGNMGPLFHYRLRPEGVFFTNEKLDFTIVSVEGTDQDKTMNLSAFGYLRLHEAKGKISEDEFCTIIQHPDGRPKQLAIFENKILSTDAPDFLIYSTDTVAGSSGSPVFNYDWVVVALHHSGVPTDLAAFQDLPDHNIQETDFPQKGNEGIRISSILAFLKTEDPDTYGTITRAANARLGTGLPVNPFQFARTEEQTSNLEGVFMAASSETPTDISIQPNLPTMDNSSNIIRFNIPIEIRLGAPFDAANGSPVVTVAGQEKKGEPVAFDKEKISNLTDRKGYDAKFLDGLTIQLADLYKPFLKKKLVASTLDGTSNELAYTHFSVVMHKVRRMSLLVGVNIDGNQEVSIKRDNTDWYLDGRMSLQYQLGESVYAKNDLDRGHMVRREDPNWGPDAQLADDDTFHYANACPQHKNLNQKEWLALETYVLKNTRVNDLKVSVFTGPVIDDNYVLYREALVPAQFFKIVAMIKKDGKPSVTGYVLTQKELISGLEKVMTDFVFSQFKTYQVPLKTIEEMTGLDLSSLLKHDPLKGDLEAVPREIEGAGDLVL